VVEGQLIAGETLHRDGRPSLNRFGGEGNPVGSLPLCLAGLAYLLGGATFIGGSQGSKLGRFTGVGAPQYEQATHAKRE
jgi:hypothetical protein